MKITICGSMASKLTMLSSAQSLMDLGYEVETPDTSESRVRVASAKDADKKQGFIDQHFRKISTSDAILVVNETKNNIEHYVGGNTLMEITYAYTQGLEVFLLHPIPELSYSDEIRGIQPIVLDGDLGRLHDYFQALPVVVMSSESPVKHSAVSRGLRKAGIRVRVEGHKVESGVNEQPMSIEESYEGAINRQHNLKTMSGLKADYLATIESGYHTAHSDHNAFGCAVIVLEKVGSDPKVGIDLNVEFPRSMTDRIPSDYPDIGVLVQQEYGSSLKDPYPFFTDGKLTRAKILENAVYNVAVQL